MWWWSWAKLAWPCGGVFHESALHADSEDQVAILEVDGEQVDMKLRVQVEGDADTLGWVIPFPGRFVEFGEVHDSTFDDLDRLTRPHLVYPPEDEHGCGCGAASKGDAMAGGLDTANLEVVAHGFTGTYEYTVFRADTASEIIGWISGKGWHVGDDLDTLQGYIDQGYLFVAVDLRPDEPEEFTEPHRLPPIRIRYEGHDLGFASLMLRHSMLDRVSTTVYVIADERATVSGWDAVEAGVVETSSEDAESTWNDLLDDASRSRPGFVVTWAGKDKARWVTRFDTRVAPSAITTDPAFATDGGTDDTLHTEIHLGVPDSEGALLVLAPLSGWALRRRRRRV